MKNIKQNVIALGIIIPVFGITSFVDSIGETGASDEEPSSIQEGLVLTQTDTLLPLSSPSAPERIGDTLFVTVTAYSSTPDQTDDTPFITASGKTVRDGIVATNLLPLGTKIKIPDIYGNRVFVVEDRMHPRKDQHVDIWFSTRWEATKFGVQKAQIEILES